MLGYTGETVSLSCRVPYWATDAPLVLVVGVVAVPSGTEPGPT
ncbi:hypothetical protein [Halorientalis salina]|nr:hypothetical protein [Halorientalis salina]